MSNAQARTREAAGASPNKPTGSVLRRGGGGAGYARAARRAGSCCPVVSAGWPRRVPPRRRWVRTTRCAPVRTPLPGCH